MIFHMPCMYMWRIFKETFGTGKRSDAVHSEIKIAAAVRCCPFGSSLYIIICLIQDRSSPAVKNGSFSNPAPLQANLSVGFIFHMPCMYMWRIFKETFGTGKRSDAVHSEIKIAAAVRCCPFGSSLYIIICLIQDRSSPAVKNGLFSNPAPLQANPSVGMIFHMPCMHMSRIFKETFGTGKRSDAVRSLSDGVCT